LLAKGLRILTKYSNFLIQSTIRSISIGYIFLFLLQVSRVYNPIPYWDDWQGYINFYQQAKSGNFDWWSQYGEHRLVLSRALSWIDLNYLNGSRWPIIVVYLFMIFAIWRILHRVFSELLEEYPLPNRAHKDVLFLPVTLLIFSFLQYENFLFAMNVGFYSSLLLPLLGLYLQKKTSELLEKNRFYYLVLISGYFCFMLAPLALANGLMSPFLGAASIFLFLKSKRYFFTYLLSGVVITFLYLKDFTRVEAHASPIDSLTHHLFAVCKFTLSLLGSPITKFTGSIFVGSFFATLSILVLAIRIVLLFRERNTGSKKNRLYLVIVLMCCYLVASAFATALGRINFGNEQAYASRYTSLGLLFLSLIWIISIGSFYASSLKQLIGISLIFVVFSATTQLSASPNQSLRDFELNSSALTIELDIEDQKILNSIYPYSALPFTLGRELISQRKTVLGSIELRKWPDLLHQINPAQENTLCYGWIDTIEPTDSQTYSKISGWLYSSNLKAETRGLVRLVDENSKIIGLAIIGLPRPDASKFLGVESEDLGFVGFILKTSDKSSIRVANSSTTCQKPLQR
jgi:hypothetical protein